MGVQDPKHVDELVGLLKQSSMFHACSNHTLVKVSHPRVPVGEFMLVGLVHAFFVLGLHGDRISPRLCGESTVEGAVV
jgi:hypothetical protein